MLRNDGRREAGGGINENVCNKRHVKKIRKRQKENETRVCVRETDRKCGTQMTGDGRWMEGYWR